MTVSMPSSDQSSGTDREADWIDASAAALFAATKELLERGEAEQVSELAIQQLLTSAIRLYVARTDGEQRTFAPFVGTYDDEMTATEVVSACSEFLRALRLSPMELSIWFRQRPGGQGELS